MIFSGLLRMGRDAELRYTTDGQPVLNIAAAYNYGKKGEDGKRSTQWLQLSFFGKRAESLTPYLLRGSMHCFTLDEVHIQTFRRQDGSEGVKLAARVLDVELGPRTDGQAGAPAPRPAPPPPRPAPPPAAGSGFEDMDPEIPF